MSDAFGSYGTSIKVIEGLLDQLREQQRREPDLEKDFNIAVTVLLTAIERLRMQEDAERKDFEEWWAAERGASQSER